jgi:hypothetical protein
MASSESLGYPLSVLALGAYNGLDSFPSAYSATVRALWPKLAFGLLGVAI